MTAREPSRLGSGVFRRLVHVIDPDAYVIDFHGVQLYVARCGAVAVPIVHIPPVHPLLWCPECHGSRSRVN